MGNMCRVTLNLPQELLDRVKARAKKKSLQQRTCSEERSKWTYSLQKKRMLAPSYYSRDLIRKKWSNLFDRGNKLN